MKLKMIEILLSIVVFFTQTGPKVAFSNASKWWRVLRKRANETEVPNDITTSNSSAGIYIGPNVSKSNIKIGIIAGFDTGIVTHGKENNYDVGGIIGPPHKDQPLK